MTADELVYNTVEYMGDSADFFTINDRFTGYTRDHVLFHILDINSNAYTTYSKDQLNAAFASGYFENPGTVSAPANSNAAGNVPDNSGSSILPDFSSWTTADYVKYGFLALAAVMIFHIATK